MRPDTKTTPSAGTAAQRYRAFPPGRRLVLLALVPAAAIAAACGSSSTTSSTSTTQAPTTSSSAAAPNVQTANSAKFGAILVDSQGRTLYTLTSGGKAVSCTGACLTVWPAALLPAGQTAVVPGPGVSNVTAVAASGGQQLAYTGLPLYRFSGDVSAGATNGDGINSFGGVWHVVKTSGGATGGAGGGTATTAGGRTSTTAGGGYSGGGY